MTIRRLMRIGPTDPEAGTMVGVVALISEVATFAGSAEGVFRQLREERGDVDAARLLIDEGWSNGQGTMFLGPPLGD